MTLTRRFALTIAAALAATPAVAQTPPATSLYICIYRTGPAWKPGKPMSEQGLGPHGAYMKHLRDEGRLAAGGPMIGVDGGLAILRAASPEEAKAIFAADPAITAGIFTAEVRGWGPQFDDGKPLVAR